MTDTTIPDYDDLAGSAAGTIHDDQPAGDAGAGTDRDPLAALDEIDGGDLGAAAGVQKKTKVRGVIRKVASRKTDEGSKIKVVLDLEVVAVVDAHGDPKLVGQEHSLWCCVGGRGASAKDTTRGKADLYKAARAAGCPLDPGDLRRTARGAKMDEALVGCEMEYTLAPGKQGGVFVNV